MKKRALCFVSIITLAAVSCSWLTACTDLGGLFDKFLGGKDHSHEYVKTVVEPTCTESGYNLFECSCGDSYKSNKVPATGHKETVIKGRAASCSSGGLSDGKKCEVCDKITQTQQYIPALEHDYRLQTIDGEQKEICEVCGAEKLLHVHRKRAGVITQNKSECGECNSYYKIDAAGGNALYGYYDFYYTENAEEKQSLYFDMYSACQIFSKSTDNVVSDTVNSSSGTVTFYSIADISLSDYSLSADDIYAVWKVFYLENPAYYWLDNSCFLYTLNNKPSRLPLCIDGIYSAYKTRRICDNEILQMAEECSLLVAETSSETKKAVAIHDYIAAKMQYALTESGLPSTEAWAHNIVGAAQNGKGVCETYAKTYQYLCALNSINCITVSGMGYTEAGSEGHAWNYIEISGRWYMVDVTWDDSLNNYDYMGACGKDIETSHIADTTAGSGINYLYKLPALSETRLQINQTRNSYV